MMAYLRSKDHMVGEMVVDQFLYVYKSPNVNLISDRNLLATNGHYYLIGHFRRDSFRISHFSHSLYLFVDTDDSID